MQDAPPIRNSPGFSIEKPLALSTHSHHAHAAANGSTPVAAAIAQAAVHPVAVSQFASSADHGNSDSTAPGETADQSLPAQIATPTQLSRDQILDATWQCLREKGYDATTIRQIATRLDCAIGSIYRYYKDKHDLLSCVTQRPFEAVAAAAEAGESFPATARMYAKLAAGETQSYMLMFWLANQKLNGKSQAQATIELPDVISNIIQAWSLQTGSKQAAMARWSMLHGAVTAGVDPLAMLTSTGLMMGLSVSGRPLATQQGVQHVQASQDDQDEPHDRTAQQIVTVMRTPPLPRQMRDAAADNKPQATSNISENSVQQDTAHSRVSLRQKEDVCLL